MRNKALAILLIFLIMTLSILDAPEFVCCNQTGVCEFLEIARHLDESLKDDIMRYHVHSNINELFLILENVIKNEEFIQNIIFFYLPMILKSIPISLTLQNLNSPDMKNIKLCIPHIENGIMAPSLKLIEMSIIRS